MARLCAVVGLLAAVWGAPLPVQGASQARNLASANRPVSDPISVVFIIDNSGSMSDGLQGNDPDQARFRIVRSLLDSIFLAAPGSEAGLVVFSNRLHFDARDDSLFKPAFPGDTSQHDAYVPLIDLEGILPGGGKGIDTLKRLLDYTDNGNLIHATKRPPTRINSTNPGTDLRSGTDITLAFQAAKTAMADAKHSKDRQALVFLSDGEPANLDDIRKPMENEYVQGAGLPKTLVVFFRRMANPTAPNSIVTMVDNIRANGYSASNPKSAYFAVNLPGAQLISLLLAGVQEASSVRRRGLGREVAEPGFAPAYSGYRIFTGYRGFAAYEGSYRLITIDGRRVKAEVLHGAPQAPD